MRQILNLKLQERFSSRIKSKFLKLVETIDFPHRNQKGKIFFKKQQEEVSEENTFSKQKLQKNQTIKMKNTFFQKISIENTEKVFLKFLERNSNIQEIH